MTLRQRDALNRAVRTAWQVVGIEVLVTILPLVNDALDGSDPVSWGNIGKAAIRTALGAVLAYVMRLRIPPKDTPPPVPAPGG